MTQRQTSREAHDLIRPKKATIKLAILDYLARTAYATCHEVERELKLKHQTASARLTELYQAGKIVETGIVINGHTVWAIAPVGYVMPPRPCCESCGRAL